MMPRFFTPLLLAGCFLGAPLASAGIEFEKTTLTATAKHSDDETAVAFSFKVTGERPVSILDLQTFCSCLSAQTDGNKKVYQPGESGRVEAVFQLGSFEGEQTKELILRTDDPEHKETKLSVTITIPPLFDIQPAQVTWTVGETPSMKSMRIKMVGDEPVKVTAAVSTREIVKAEVKEITAGREYEIQITPTTTESPLLGLVRIETDCKFPRYQRKLVFFNIARPKTPPEEKPAPAPAAEASPAPVAEKP